MQYSKILFPLIAAFTLIAAPHSTATAQATADGDGPAETLKPSGTVPIVYVTTDDGAPIVSKTEYKTATIHISDPGTGEDILGSAAEPVVLQIRGRGNSSWRYEKKPYKLKLDKKASPFGMPKSKHFVLLAHAPSFEYLRESVSFELARLIGLGWVPRFKPVELVLNGEYMGVYAFGENVRIDEGRLEIAEQPDENTDPATVAEGWLVEMDNYPDDPQVVIPQSFDTGDTKANRKMFTIKTPEVLSEEQTQWIVSELTEITRAIHNPDKNTAEWLDKIDLTSFARYYIIQELTGNLDAYVGSTYIHHDKTGDKWMAGPMWDSGYSFSVSTRKYNIIETRRNVVGDYVVFAWISELWKFKHFRNAVSEEWHKFYPSGMQPIYDYLDSFYNETKDAYAVDALRWPQYHEATFGWSYSLLKSQLPGYTEWFDDYVAREGSVAESEASNSKNITVKTDGNTVSVMSIDGTGISAAIYDAAGSCLFRGAGPVVTTDIPQNGIYIIRATDAAGTPFITKAAIARR